MSNKRYSVLVVDDQPNWCELLVDLLKEEFDVKSVKDYEDALNVIQSQTSPFHVVVTDMRLKDEVVGNEDGLKLIEYLNRQADETKTILVTGYATVDTAIRAGIRLKVYEYLQKGRSDGSNFDYQKFQQTVRDAANEAEQKHQSSLYSSSIKKEVFVVMPFKPQKIYNGVYKSIKEMVGKAGYSCHREDDFSLPRPVMKDILEHIRDAKFIVADLSGRRPNVFFEVGIAHALGKSVILLTQNEADVPPQLRTVRYIPYDKNAPELPRVSSAIRALEQKNFPPFFENKGRYQPDSTSCLVLLPKTSNETKLYQRVIKPTVEEHELQCTLTQNIFGSNEVLDGIWERTNCARLAIADLTDGDPDVFYLSGIAYGLNSEKQKTIYLAQKETSIPFDLQGIPHVIYSLKPFAKLLETMGNLSKAIEILMKDDSGVKTNILMKTEREGKQSTSILFLAAEPTDQVRLRLGQEFREIQEELLKSRERDCFILKSPQFSLRPRDITRVLRETNAKIVHFSGHGGSDGQLCFETADGGSLPVEPEILADLFRKFSKKIKCVVLNACYSEKQAEAISKHIDYVIGMRHGISDSAATAFSIGFYQALGAGEDIEEAFESGKIQAGMQSAPEYQTPILLKRSQ